MASNASLPPHVQAVRISVRDASCREQLKSAQINTLEGRRMDEGAYEDALGASSVAERGKYVRFEHLRGHRGLL